VIRLAVPAPFFEGGRKRSRFPAFRAMTAAFALSALCACDASFDLGSPGLRAAGWARLPTHDWLLNEGLGPANIIYCEVPSCPRPSVVATFSAEGEEGRRLLRALADPRSLLQAKRLPVATARDPRFKAKPSKEKPKSREKAERIEADGLAGYRVTLSPEAADGHEAYAVVLTARDGDKVRAALAVTTDPGAALDEARAAAKSFTGDADRSPPGENAIEQIAK
jgi:hypothetical protein